MIEIEKRGLGDFPEFIGKKLINIQHETMTGKHPEVYLFRFNEKDDEIWHWHCLEKGEKIEPNNYRFIGKTVFSARQYLNSDGKMVFEFVFKCGSMLSFAYAPTLPLLR